MKSALFAFFLVFTPAFSSQAEAEFCQDAQQGFLGEEQWLQGMAESLANQPTKYELEFEDGSRLVLHDAQTSDEKDIYDEVAEHPELEPALAELADPSEFANKGKGSGRRTKFSKRKARYSNRGILSPKGAWPVASGGCTTISGRASFYGGGEKLKAHTASGGRFKSGAMAAAHRTLPLGTRVAVSANGRTVSNVVINDRGPAIETGRVLDVTKGVAQRLGFVGAGHAAVQIRVCRGRTR